MKQIRKILAVLSFLCAVAFLSACGGNPDTGQSVLSGYQEAEETTVEDLPEFTGDPYVVVENNMPDFSEEELQTEAYEEYSELDELGRCGTAKANIGEELMPTEERESISQIRPSGWNNKAYDEVDGGYLYNRCHLIGFQLTAENANEENLITGTRYMNTEGMLPFENLVADYIKETDNHVLYEVTPVFEDDNLVASGVLMEAKSVEDEGEGVCFYVYVYNVQPGIEIDYATGESWESTEDNELSNEITYILNTNTMKFHKPECASVKEMKSHNIDEYSGDREKLIAMGYSPCGRCKP